MQAIKRGPGQQESSYLAAVRLERQTPNEITEAAVTVRAATSNAPKHLPVGQSIVRGALALLTTQPLTWGASLLTAMLLPRLIGADALGQLAIVVTITGLASTICVLGISEYLVRRFAQRPQTRRRDAGIALCVQTLTSCSGAMLIGLIGWLVPSSIVNYPLLLVALLPMVGAPAQTVLLSSFRGGEKHKSYAWFNAVSVVVSSVATVLVLLAGGNIVMATGTGGALAIACTLGAWKLSGIRPLLPRLERSLLSDFGEFIRGGFPFVTWQLTLLTYGQVDRVLMGIFVPTAEVGWYAAAYQIIGIVVFVPTLVIAPLFPALSRSVENPDALRKTIAQTLRVLLLLMVPLGAGTIVAAPLVPRLLGWPSDFENAVPLMTILALHLPIVAVDMVLGVVLMAINKASRLVFVGILAAGFNVTANLVLIPYFQHAVGNGAIGSSIVTVLTEVLICVGAVTLIPKRLLDPSIAWETVRVAGAGIAGAVVGLTLAPILAATFNVLLVALGLAGLFTAITFVGVAALLRALTLDDLRLLTARLPGSKH
jgi:O-antigen/teichoic acid export membrane protein